MRRSGLQARRRRRFKATTYSNHNHPVAPNLLDREFSRSGPKQAWVGDITYVETDEGWLYFAVLIDLWSRRVVGYATGDLIDRHLVLRALKMARGLRLAPQGFVHHTDRGGQYASRDYRVALDAASFRCSMSRKGNCWDNARAESFFSTIKTECLHRQPFQTREAGHMAIAEYVRWYNATRRHSTIVLVAPAIFEASFITTTAA
ncbi:MAG: transposase InsO family protein [Bradymonadia bacterium]|jgi:transposase InsO family protein